ncbi:MAG: CRISPR-associated protein Csx3 [Acaryochloris sp. SU_5_25]|nr:CRISPR-associated protein Csx3 [Acaryochloris sp. SU_5_25]
MTTFTAQLQGDILYIGLGAAADNPQIVRDAHSTILTLIQNQILTGGALLAIHGESSIIAAYGIAAQLTQRYDTIAVYDPKLSTYIVVTTHTTSYRIGDRLDLPHQGCPHPIKVALCGPPHTGKSCLREGLKQRLLAYHRQKIAPYPYIITACPDGEGAWFYGTAKTDPQLADQLKQTYKTKFTPEFAQQMAQWVNQTTRPLTIIDIGGKITPENTLILQEASHAILLWRDPLPTDDPSIDGLVDWQTYCDRLGLTTIAILKSDYSASIDTITSDSKPLIGTIHHLERGQDCSSRLTIEALATLLIQQLQSTHSNEPS